MPGSYLPAAWVVIGSYSCSLTLHSPITFQSLRIPPGLSCGDSSLFGVLWPPCYLGYSPIESWDSLSGYMHPGIACLAFWASDWPGAFWASLSD